MMKQFVILFILISAQLFGTQSTAEHLSKSENYVYICTGPKATKYHSTSSCRGLNKCSKDIIKVTQTYAEDKGRKKCKICYS